MFDSTVHVWKLQLFFQEKYLVREKLTVEKTIRECEEKAKIEAERVAKLHQLDIERCNERLELIMFHVPYSDSNSTDATVI